MKSCGEIGPCAGCTQRASASTLIGASESRPDLRLKQDAELAVVDAAAQVVGSRDKVALAPGMFVAVNRVDQGGNQPVEVALGQVGTYRQAACECETFAGRANACTGAAEDDQLGRRPTGRQFADDFHTVAPVEQQLKNHNVRGRKIGRLVRR